METITLSPQNEDIQAFVRQHQDHLLPSKKIHISDIFFKAPGATISITSGKVVLQGNQATRYAAFFGYQQDPIDQATCQTRLPLIGTDEVGNGSYFGGLAVVASLVSPEQHARLKKSRSWGF